MCVSLWSSSPVKRQCYWGALVCKSWGTRVQNEVLIGRSNQLKEKMTLSSRKSKQQKIHRLSPKDPAAVEPKDNGQSEKSRHGGICASCRRYKSAWLKWMSFYAVSHLTSRQQGWQDKHILWPFLLWRRASSLASLQAGLSQTHWESHRHPPHQLSNIWAPSTLLFFGPGAAHCTRSCLRRLLTWSPAAGGENGHANHDTKCGEDLLLLLLLFWFGEKKNAAKSTN